MPRAQNAHAQVNAGFLYKFDKNQIEPTVMSSRIIYGGLSAKFVHARMTEMYLVGKRLFTNETLQEALHVLEKDLIVEEIPGELKPEYRKKCALGLFYKVKLNHLRGTLLPFSGTFIRVAIFYIMFLIELLNNLRIWGRHRTVK